MAFFKMRYDKPGPGVSKNERSKPGPVHFFELYGRKFWELVRINLIYAGCCILFCVPVLFTIFTGAFGTWKFYLSLLPIILTGPFTAGFTLVLRNFARERPTFLWGDFKDAAKQNRKQALAASAIAVCGFVLLFFLFFFYWQNMAKHPAFFIPLSLVCMCGLLFLFMHYYVFAIMVTFNLPLKDIYRNAFLFAFLGIGQNLLVTVCGIVILFLTCYTVPILALLLPVITISSIAFLINFTVWKLIKKYMIDPHPELLPKETETETIFQDKEK